jgi:two-component system LytT family response regulator
MKVLIVDDEELARRKIQRLLGKGYVIREARHGQEALQILREWTPDLLFLDIEMPELSGFDVLQNLEQRPFKIIFQTAHDAFALKAFDENAIDYLLKPFDQERFDRALARALAASEGERRLAGLEQQRYLEKISVRQGATTRIVAVDDIDYFSSQDHYTFIHRGDDEWICDLSLNFLEQRLSPEKFLRTHRHLLVRRQRVVAVHGGPTMHVELSSGRCLPVARARRAHVQSLLA